MTDCEFVLFLIMLQYSLSDIHWCYERANQKADINFKSFRLQAHFQSESV